MGTQHNMFSRAALNSARFFSRRVIATTEAPIAMGPYSQAIVAGSQVFVSGQLGMCPVKGQLVSEKVEDQAEQALRNLVAVLKGAGCTPEDVVKCTVFLTDMNDFAAINAIYAKVFTSNPPARSCVAVKTLPRNANFEVECIAYKQ
eukprot:GDKJ01036011.1.p1 GENE.GDKJ01036011.1~~GDKJ01036011.1.p1  ORF type:complete len:146 (-),score=40.08 GDKJ01036011.1:55-492(-)